MSQGLNRLRKVSLQMRSYSTDFIGPLGVVGNVTYLAFRERPPDFFLCFRWLYGILVRRPIVDIAVLITLGETGSIRCCQDQSR